MRKRFNSESENSVTQVIVEEDNLYKDKAIGTENLATKLFKNFYRGENSQPAYSNTAANDDYTLPEPEPEEIFVMAARDRTVEFANTVRTQQGRNINRVVNMRDPKKVKQMQSYSEFMGIAKNIGRNIASTYAKLEKLTLRKYPTLLMTD
jgi:syntaxin 5